MEVGLRGVRSLSVADRLHCVSILVLMEVGLRDITPELDFISMKVSILVLMEVGLREWIRLFTDAVYRVSILVLMEVGLRVCKEITMIDIKQCFNPCFNGSWSES